MREHDGSQFLLYSLFSLFFSTILLYFFIKSTADHVLQLPPGPYAWPIVGNILNLNIKKPHITLANLARTYGPLMSLKLGSRLVIVASSSAAAREVFQSHDREFCGRYATRVSYRVPKFNSSVITMCTECNESWRFLRQISHRELFSSQALESHSELRAKKVGELLEFLGSKDGEVVEIPDTVFANVANTLSNIMVSQDVIDCQDQIEEMRRFVRRVLETAIPGLVDIYPAFLGLDFWSHPKAVAFIKTNKAIWGDIISKRSSQEVGRIRSRDLLDVLIQNSFDDNPISNFLIELFVTSETITIAIEWAMAELTINQNVLAKLRDELAKAVEGTIVHESHLDNLPYLQSCIKEILRLHPPNPLLVPRRAPENCTVMNYTVPRDCWVIVNVYAIGRDAMTWEDPLSFKPERFLRKNVDLKGTCYGLLPFGGGRRICVGLSLALKQIQLLLASLFYGFDWSFPHGTEATNLDMSEKFVVSLRRENPLLLIPRKRSELKVE